MKDSIVEYFSGHEGYKCGYCKSETTNYSHGMWAHALTPAVYEALLNRGWRRSGSYMYKPTNNVTCCPLYTINCHSLEFSLSRSQRKVLRRFNHYLLTGELRTISKYEKSQDKMEETIPEFGYREGVPAGEVSLKPEPDDITKVKVETDTVSNNQIPSSTENSIPTKNVEVLATETGDAPKRRKSESILVNESTGSESSLSSAPSNYISTRQKGIKARDIRIQRKKDKLIARGIDPATVLLPRKPQAAKTVEELTKEIKDAKVKVKFQVKLLKTDTTEFSELIPIEHKLYRQYQMTIHGDTEAECTLRQYTRFLCDNPLNSASDDFTGAYHQHYYMNDKLVAVGVLDILPTCVSSVYFFYDPELMALSLGTYGALREIAFVRQLAGAHRNLTNYYMGFYIHSCVKMRYKGSFTPSFLLCPETYTWKLLDNAVRNKLTLHKYSRLNDDEVPPERNRLERVQILHRRSAMPYSIYELKRGAEDQDEIQEYCNLVGEKIAQKLYLYRA